MQKGRARERVALRVVFVCDLLLFVWFLLFCMRNTNNCPELLYDDVLDRLMEALVKMCWGLGLLHYAYDSKHVSL